MGLFKKLLSGKGPEITETSTAWDSTEFVTVATMECFSVMTNDWELESSFWSKELIELFPEARELIKAEFPIQWIPLDDLRSEPNIQLKVSTKNSEYYIEKLPQKEGFSIIKKGKDWSVKKIFNSNIILYIKGKSDSREKSISMGFETDDSSTKNSSIESSTTERSTPIQKIDISSLN